MQKQDFKTLRGLLVSFFLSFFICYLSSPNVELTSQGLTTQIPVGQMPVAGVNRLWIRTLHRYARAGVPESMINKISGPPPEIIQGRSQTENIGYTLRPRIESNPGRRVERQRFYRHPTVKD